MNIDDWYHINPVGAGLCGFHSLGIALDSRLFGERYLWMIAGLFNPYDRPTGKIVTYDESFAHVTFLASRMYQIISLLINDVWN